MEAEYHVLVGDVPSQEFVEASPNLKSLIILWAGLPTATRELMLQGKTALILGYGAIGQYVGKVLSAMDMRVIGLRRNPEVTIDDGGRLLRKKPRFSQAEKIGVRGATIATRGLSSYDFRLQSVS